MRYTFPQEPFPFWIQIHDSIATQDYFRKGREGIKIRPVPYNASGSYQLPTKRPNHLYAMSRWQLIDEIHLWIEGMGFEYDLEVRPIPPEHLYGWAVGFKTRDEAMAFKLAWGGK